MDPNIPTSSGNQNVPSTSSPNTSKTQVFILRPDMLKKLGIAAQIPNLQSLVNLQNKNITPAKKIQDTSKNSSSKKKITIKEIEINKQDVATTKTNTDDKNLNRNQNKIDVTTKDKLLSMLSAKLNKAKIQPTFDSEKNQSPKQNITEKIANNEVNINQLNLKSNTENSRVTVNISGESISKSDLNNFTDIAKNRIDKNVEEKQLLHNDDISENENKVTNKTDYSENSNDNAYKESFSNSDFSSEIEIKINEKISEIENEINKNICEKTKEISKGNKKLKTEIEKNVIEQNPEKQIVNENMLENNNLISSVRKSNRKRKLSSAYEDYISDLKLHDCTVKNITNRNRKSSDENEDKLIHQPRKKRRCSIINIPTNTEENLEEDIEFSLNRNLSKPHKVYENLKKVTVQQENPENTNEIVTDTNFKDPHIAENFTIDVSDNLSLEILQDPIENFQISTKISNSSKFSNSPRKEKIDEDSSKHNEIINSNNNNTKTDNTFNIIELDKNKSSKLTNIDEGKIQILENIKIDPIPIQSLFDKCKSPDRNLNLIIQKKTSEKNESLKNIDTANKLPVSDFTLNLKTKLSNSIGLEVNANLSKLEKSASTAIDLTHDIETKKLEKNLGENLLISSETASANNLQTILEAIKISTDTNTQECSIQNISNLETNKKLLEEIETNSNKTDKKYIYYVTTLDVIKNDLKSLETQDNVFEDKISNKLNEKLKLDRPGESINLRTNKNEIQTNNTIEFSENILDNNSKESELRVQESISKISDETVQKFNLQIEVKKEDEGIKIGQQEPSSSVTSINLMKIENKRQIVESQSQSLNKFQENISELNYVTNQDDITIQFSENISSSEESTLRTQKNITKTSEETSQNIDLQVEIEKEDEEIIKMGKRKSDRRRKSINLIENKKQISENQSLNKCQESILELSQVANSDKEITKIGKRKLGRPRKSINLMKIENKKQIDESQSLNKCQENISELNRTPNKNKTIQCLENMLSNNVEEHETQIEENVVKSSEETSQNIHLQMEIEKENENIIKFEKRKRGRPRKSTNLIKTKNETQINTSLNNTRESTSELNQATNTETNKKEEETNKAIQYSEKIVTNILDEYEPHIQENISKTLSEISKDEINLTQPLNEFQENVSKLNQTTTDDNLSENNEAITEPIVNRKLSRPNKDIDKTMEESLSSHCNTSLLLNLTLDQDADPRLGELLKRRKQGRPPKSVQQQELLEKKSHQNSIKIIDGCVICGVCNEKIKKTQWNSHSIHKHYNLCWRVGEPKVDLEDKQVVQTILQKLIKIKKIMLTCSNCGDKKKSVVGYMSHLETCRKSEEEISDMKVKCPICARKILPSSFYVHVFNHKKMKESQEILEKEQNSIKTDGKIKRKAAEKAIDLIQEVSQEENAKRQEKSTEKKLYKKVTDTSSITASKAINQKLSRVFKMNGQVSCSIKNCTFTTTKLNEIRVHINNRCPTLKDDDYICRQCLYVSNNIVEMKNHVVIHMNDTEFNIVENGESDDDEGSDFDDANDDETDSKKSLKNNKKDRVTEVRNFELKVDFLKKERRIRPSIIAIYPATVKWTLQFQKKNFVSNIFENFKCLSLNWCPVSQENQQKYLPIIKQSMCVKRVLMHKNVEELQGKNHDWKRFQLFENKIDNDIVTIFCGGPIKSLAWLPTPYYLIVDQYLAVSIERNCEASYKMSESYSGEGIIQFWNFGPLQNGKEMPHAPILEFCLAHDHGMIWCMEWCPSGCYDSDIETTNNTNKLRRLGLLALACTDGTIHIYSICFPEKLPTCDGEKIYKNKEQFRLIMEDKFENKLGLWEYQATKISWSKGVGHNIIAGGYTNGLVCLWDLNTESPLLKSEENGTVVLKPYFSFQPHRAAISVLVLHSLDDGKRWLLTGSWDRSAKYWDLTDTSKSLSSWSRRGLITDGIWLTNWLCSYLAYDDVFNIAHTSTTVQNVRDFGFKQCSALPANSVVNNISSCDWSNAIVQGTLAGELISSFPRHHLLMSIDLDKGFKCKRIMYSYTEIIEKNLSPEERIKKIKNKTDNVKKNVDLSDKDDEFLMKYVKEKDNEEYQQEPITYEDAEKKYGLIFCDFPLDNINNMPEEPFKWVRQSNKMHEMHPEIYPFMSLNQVFYNPNKQAYLYVSSGYHAGFLRLACARFINNKISEI